MYWYLNKVISNQEVTLAFCQHSYGCLLPIILYNIYFKQFAIFVCVCLTFFYCIQRKPYYKEEGDLGAVTFDMQETVIPQDILSNTQKVHYFQAIVNNPIELGVQYLFSKKIGKQLFFVFSEKIKNIAITIYLYLSVP